MRPVPARRLAPVMGALFAAACASTPTLRIASAILRDSQGQEIATASMQDSPEGVIVVVTGSRVPAGLHGIHVHEVGRCDAPDFISAGPHHNPTNRQHGLRNPAGWHAGDLPNLTADATGAATYSAVIAGHTLASLLDVTGSALVLHAAADDQVTDPSGNSGRRIACGVLTGS